MVQPNCKGDWEMEAAHGPRKRKQEFEGVKTLSGHRRKLTIIINYELTEAWERSIVSKMRLI